MNNPLEPIYEALEQIQKCQAKHLREAYKALGNGDIQTHNLLYEAGAAYQTAVRLLQQSLAKAESEVKDGVE